ncbi:hypothetical protein AVEN_202073-1 [Araneus ventricosus]|uniref:Uncharacterized protein n=1 Tax=Araneus ventricosus TaxID=182803 RepID=A0A4Y2KY48_ARAVE|nr:hypothetical protein AVEN_202073-1 [Araneus ventricosus]
MNWNFLKGPQNGPNFRLDRPMSWLQKYKINAQISCLLTPLLPRQGPPIPQPCSKNGWKLGRHPSLHIVSQTVINPAFTFTADLSREAMDLDSEIKTQSLDHHILNIEQKKICIIFR